MSWSRIRRSILERDDWTCGYCKVYDCALDNRNFHERRESMEEAGYEAWERDYLEQKDWDAYLDKELWLDTALEKVA